MCLPWIIPPLDGVPWSLVCHRERQREREGKKPKQTRKKNPMTDSPLFFLSPLLTYEVKATTQSTKPGVCGGRGVEQCVPVAMHPPGAALCARPSRSTCSPGPRGWSARPPAGQPARPRGGGPGLRGAWPRAGRAPSDPRPARPARPPAASQARVPGRRPRGSGVKCASEAFRSRGELPQERSASCRKPRFRCS